MLLTTDYRRGDIVLVNFVFAEETGSKRRPVLLLSSDEYMEGRQEVIVSAITSNTRRLLTGDHLMNDWEEAGLLFPSVTTGILRTIKQSMIERKMGVVSPRDLTEIESNLSQILELNR
ncbi:MAG: type II toxin-antitoxin system PemK/MazF family toxin [Chloroflexi bacterium]|nr:type II toxin-antitoxin system PemK/MazF family toxin [Chloroflexota bacterium]MCH8893997.1 type II toxin-antitoxin system PemK/MazF family toxin [Chloroflexota bacterium]MCI0789716.1 type II toxin-antitoxin system PemK/MazF family toxin [Chloroflexota bacterium]MCI0802631.1 type II toxin-antitoxin system PemK/MazF family toxin [Chloroflexota bacterium]MCI0810123.1 type II toxin-antitoxin system PemK/MazF family toxin [Chloroflexota bacterium]